MNIYGRRSLYRNPWQVPLLNEQVKWNEKWNRICFTISKMQCTEWLWAPNVHIETIISKRNWIDVIKEWSTGAFTPCTISGYWRKMVCESILPSRGPWTSQPPELRNEFLLVIDPWSIVSLNSTTKYQYKRYSYLCRQACILKHRILEPITTLFWDLLCISQRS